MMTLKEIEVKAAKIFEEINNLDELGQILVIYDLIRNSSDEMYAEIKAVHTQLKGAYLLSQEEDLKS